jgi:hypothetical protein
MSFSADHPRPTVSVVARTSAIVANVSSLLLLVFMSYAWMREGRTFYLVSASIAAFNLVVVAGQKLHARRRRPR